MKYKISYCSENHSTFIAKFIGFGFERPAGNEIIESEGHIRFSCWFAHTLATDPFIIIKEGAVTKEYKCNIDRPDVKKHFFDKGITQLAVCGFSFSIEVKSDLKISVLVGGEAFEVWSFKLWEVNESIKIALDEIHSGLTKSNKRYDALIDVLSVQDFFLCSKKDISQLKSYGKIFFDEKNLLGFIESLSNPLWNLIAIEQSLAERHLSIKGFFSQRSIMCEGSIAVDDYNYLFFREGGVPFFIVQHITVSCVIFPTLLVAINISVEQWCIDSIKKLKDIYLFFLKEKYFLKNNRDGATFHGVHISQSRPYHTVYDVIQGIYLLRDVFSAQKDNIQTFVINDKMSFFSDDIYLKISNTAALNFIHYKDKLMSFADGYTLFPAVQYSILKNNETINEISSLLIDDEESIDAINEGYECVIWIGVSTEKRSWTEQVEGWKNILNSLSEHKKILVVVDGRTFPLVPTSSDVYIKACEDKIFSVLVSECKKVNFINAIGMRVSEKINLAAKIDLFVTSYATDSIYPSCVARKPGVVYSPDQIGAQKYLHIHHDVVEVEQSFVKSSSNDPTIPWHHISVSMDWRKLLEYIEYRMSTIKSHRGKF